jgi:hypothetical protein
MSHNVLMMEAGIDIAPIRASPLGDTPPVAGEVCDCTSEVPAAADISKSRLPAS